MRDYNLNPKSRKGCVDRSSVDRGPVGEVHRVVTGGSVSRHGTVVRGWRVGSDSESIWSLISK